MHQIQLNDDVFEEAQRRAAQAGFASVDAYVAVLLEQGFQAPPESLDYLFTPQRLAQIDRAAAQIDAGQGRTPQQVEQELAERRTQWLSKRPS